MNTTKNRLGWTSDNASIAASTSPRSVRDDTAIMTFVFADRENSWSSLRNSVNMSLSAEVIFAGLVGIYAYTGVFMGLSRYEITTGANDAGST